MERLRSYLVAGGLTLASIGALGGGEHARQMNSLEIGNRERILTTYNFTQQAQMYLRITPVFLHQDWLQGGGLAHPEGFAECGIDTRPHAKTDEACLHEMSHLWNFHMQYLDPQVDTIISQTFHHVAEERPPGDYWHDLVFGDGKQWKGMDGNSSEEFASGASYLMGQLEHAPVELLPIYESEFTLK